MHATGFAHTGIAFAHQRTAIGRVVRALTLIHEILSVEEMANRVEHIEAFRASSSLLQDFHTIIKEKDHSFGNLVRVRNKRQEFLWVHPQFEGEY